MKSNDGSINAVCRDDMGKYLGASAVRYIGINDPATPEALACRKALSLALDLLLSHPLVAPDCKEVVSDIYKGMGGLYASIVKEIISQGSQFLVCSFLFEGRETNFEAHSLAKHTLGQSPGRHLWLVNPLDLSCIPMYLDIDL